MPVMAPNAEDCETARLNDHDGVPPRRVLPGRPQLALAWTENDEAPDKSPGENKRLLPVTKKPPPKGSRLQAGLTLGVHSKYPTKSINTKTLQKTKFQKRKEKLIEVFKPPYFILSMIIIVVCVHLFGSADLRISLEWAPGVWRHEPWRLLTYGVVHASPTHLALNALVALAVGWRLEREQGWWRIACVWWCGVCAGALGSGALQSHVRVVGASAAVYALLTAHLPNVCLRFGHIPLWWFRPLSVVVLGASEGCWALMRSPPISVPGSLATARAHENFEHVAWSAHALGAAIGVPLAFLVFTGENDKKPVMIAARIASGLMLVAGATLTIVYYTLWTDVDET